MLGIFLQFFLFSAISVHIYLFLVFFLLSPPPARNASVRVARKRLRKAARDHGRRRNLVNQQLILVAGSPPRSSFASLLSETVTRPTIYFTGSRFSEPEFVQHGESLSGSRSATGTHRDLLCSLKCSKMLFIFTSCFSRWRAVHGGRKETHK